MRNTLVIAKKEWINFFTSPIGYIFSGILLVVVNWLFFNDLYLAGQADLKPFWTILTFLLSIFIPAISMGLIAEEKKNSTWELILSLPIKEWELVIGKFIGSGLYLLFTLFLTSTTIGTIYWLGNPDFGVMISSLLGVIALSLAYLSLGIFTSSLSVQPIVGFISSSAILLLNNLFSQEMFLSRVPTWLRAILENLSLSWRYSNFTSGKITLSDVVFFISWIISFLLLTTLVLKRRDK